jgi:hypothetical protein
VGRPGILARERMTHEETDETPVLCNSKDKYFLLKERQSQNGRLARAVTSRVGRGGRDIGREGNTRLDGVGR